MKGIAVVLTVQKFVNDAPFLAIFLVFWVGALASLSSCTIVRVPVVLSYVAGAADSKKKAILVTALFVCGLVASYTALGIFFGLVGNLAFAFIQINKYIFWALGVLLLVCGLFVAGLLNVRFLHPTLELKDSLRHMKYVGAFVFGIFFALLEVPACPCCGSILLIIAGLVVTQNLSAYAVLIFFSFALGQSFPVLAVALSTSLIKTDLIMYLAPKIHRLEERVELLAGNVLMALGVYFLVIA